MTTEEAGEVADLIARLKATPNWLREEFGHYKAVRTIYDRAPFDAAAPDIHERRKGERRTYPSIPLGTRWPYFDRRK